MKSIKTHLTVVLLLCILLPTGLIGGAGYWFVFNTIKENRIENVGAVAVERYTELRRWLHESNDRGKSLLDALIADCRYSDNGVNACVRSKLEQFIAINHAAGISFHSGIEGDLAVGSDVMPLDKLKPFLPGQIAATSIANGIPLLSLTAVDPVSGFSLAVTYPGQTLQGIFVSSPVLGQSGETFLVDSGGFFITSHRYASQQGVVRPISAVPMQHCLHGESKEMLGLDYRNVSIIHGFQFVPEIGGGCIMAHVDQKEAFAPLMRLVIGLAIVAFIFACSAWLIARLIGKRLLQPIIALANMAKALSQGDFTQRVSLTSFQEIAELSQLFNSMAGQLDRTINQLKASELELEQKIVERTDELRKRHEKYYSVIQTIVEGFWLVNQEGRLLEVNPTYAHLSGYSMTELIGMRITDLEARELSEETAEHIQKIIQHGSDTFETQHRRKDGSLWDVEVNAAFIDEDGGYFVGFLKDITERKLTEQLLRDSEAYQHAIFDASPDAILISNEHGLITMVNQQAQSLLGYSDNELPGLTIEALVPERFRAEHPALRAQFAASGRVGPMGIGRAVKALRRDGSELDVEITLSPIQTEQGLFFASALRDITERKQIQQLLEDKEQMLSESQRIAHIGSWSVDLVTGYITWSEEMYRICGVNPQTFGHSERTFLERVHPDDRSAIKKWINSCKLRKEPPELDFRMLLADGSIRFIRGNGDLQLDDMNRPLRMVGSAQDITEHKRAELAVRKSEEQLRTIMDNASTVIFMKDLDGRYLHINRQYEKLFHVTNEAMQGNTDYDIFPKDMADRLVNNDQIVVQTGQLLEVEEQVPHDDGCHIYLSVKFPIRNDAGEIYAVCGLATDITERKRIELDLHIAAIAFECQEAMVITDAANIIIRINKAFTESTGYSEQDALGEKISILKSGRHDAAFYAAMWESIVTTGTWQGEVWDRRKNGEIYPKWLSITAVKGHDGLVTHYVGMHTDITERKAVEEQIKQLAFYDPLTGLPNRRLLYERLKHGINVERREGKLLALMMLDLDRFKAVNDSLGHLAGDELLQQAAERITARLRDVDMVARLGGDEFVVLLEDITRPEDAARIAEEIIADLTKPFGLTQSDDVQISVSIGISLYPQHGDSPEMLMDHADAALYQAKGAGRGRFDYFSEELTLAAQERMALETRLRHAIEQHELQVFFQPQVNIASGRIVGAEALLRWHDPLEGLIMPSRFIPIAEETGLIIEIGTWVLRETCRQGREWLDAGLPPITLAVNVSVHQFRRSDFCALVATVLEETGFPPQYLELEITESGLMGKLVEDTATDLLNRLRVHGVRLAIDDFGTGYSSLSYLKHFPLDVLKIDKSFIDDIPFQQDDMEIAATVVSMGHILGFKVLAEGVETLEQLAFLQEKGCDSYQGFIKSKPVSAEEFAKFLRDL